MNISTWFTSDAFQKPPMMPNCLQWKSRPKAHSPNINMIGLTAASWRPGRTADRQGPRWACTRWAWTSRCQRSASGRTASRSCPAASSAGCTWERRTEMKARILHMNDWVKTTFLGSVFIEYQDFLLFFVFSGSKWRVNRFLAAGWRKEAISRCHVGLWKKCNEHCSTIFWQFIE